MNITVKVVPHETQRYPTIGDWYFDDKFEELIIIVSDLGDWRFNALVALHEQIEALLCYNRGIKEEDVSAFDIQYEKARPENDFSEPGDSVEAPYYHEHQYATHIEQDFARHLNVDWGKYEEVINSL